jgi:hypothetical protein
MRATAVKTSGHAYLFFSLNDYIIFPHGTHHDN